MDIFEWLKGRGITVKNTVLVEQAFIHSSYANEHKLKHDNERLEFMGDANWSARRHSAFTAGSCTSTNS